MTAEGLTRARRRRRCSFVADVETSACVPLWRYCHVLPETVKLLPTQLSRLSFAASMSARPSVTLVHESPLSVSNQDIEVCFAPYVSSFLIVSEMTY